MTLILNRRHFIGSSALLAGFATGPLRAGMPLDPTAKKWTPVQAALQVQGIPVGAGALDRAVAFLAAPGDM